MIFVLIALGLLVVLALAAIGIYNGLVKQRNLSQEAWRQIDVELTRRHDLIGWMATGRVWENVPYFTTTAPVRRPHR